MIILSGKATVAYCMGAIGKIPKTIGKKTVAQTEQFYMEFGLNKKTFINNKNLTCLSNPLKMKLYHYLLLTAGSFALNDVATAQGTLADYQRAERFNDILRNKTYYAPNDVTFDTVTQKFYYSEQEPHGKVYKSLDPKTHELAVVAPKKDDLQQGTSNKWRSRNSETEKFVKSPDGKWIAYIKEFNVYIRPSDKKDGEIQLSYDGRKSDYYDNNLKWSPNSKQLATFRIQPGDERTLYLIESSPTTQLQPILQTRNYPKPGDVLTQKMPALFDINTKKQLPLDLSLCANQYFVRDIAWRKDSREFTFEYNQRGHQVYSLIAVSADGKLREAAADHAKTYFNYYAKKYRFDLNDGKEIIWMSERDGWNHLYLYGADGKVKNQITKGNWVVRHVIHVDEKNRTVIFEGSGMEKNQDPYFIQYYKIGLDGKGLVKLTTENGNHKAVFDNRFETFVDCFSRIDQPQTSVLRDARNGKIIKTLEQSNIDDLLKTGWKMPEVFSAKGRDEQTDIWGMVIRPSNFDPNKKYPIIEYIYAGPHDSFVPKNFIADTRVPLHELAELGFIVVQIDGMGTSNRSKAFQDVSYKNLKDAGFPDRILWMKALANKYSYLDTTKVGIYGTSAGGQNSTAALLFHPEFYKVAVSSCGCHDNRMDKISWNEQFMGLLGPHYAENSNVENAWRLQGKLMLIVGELDDNVDPSSTLQMVNQLIKHNKNFDFLMVPGMKHAMGGDFGEHKRRDFFVKNLLGVDPPEWNWEPKISIPKP